MLYRSSGRNNNVNKFQKEGMKMFEQYDEILTVADVMELLYVGKNTVYRLLHEGELKAFRIGKTWKIPKESLADFVIKKGCSR